MPRLEEGLKLDFKDVLIRPRRSILNTRADVDIECEYIFRNSKNKYKAVPVMAANMDSVGTFEMARVLAEYGMFTSIYKHCPLEDWVKLAEEQTNGHDIWSKIGLTTGLRPEEFAKARGILDAVPQLRYVFLDVANGYMESFVDFVRRAREQLPKHTLIAGNVATPEMVEELILTGADVVKVGLLQRFLIRYRSI